jgi:ribosomal protein S18 acetylase RimI-like enzyme
MSELITSVDDPRLPEVTQRHWYNFFKQYSQGEHFQYFETPYYSRIEYDKTMQGWTGVHLSNIPEEKADEVITSVIKRYEEIEKPWTWWIGPTCKPDNLSEYLEKHGLKHDSDTPYMALELEKLNDIRTPDELEVIQVQDSEMLYKWSEAIATGFGFSHLVDDVFDVENHESLWNLPNRIRYVGLMDGAPVCGSTVFVDQGVAGIYQVATVSEARGKGYGTAVTLAPLKYMSMQGVRVGVLHSSRKGYGVYKRIGFKDIGKHSLYRLT